MGFAGIAYGIYWWQWQGGKQRCVTCMTERQTRSDAVKNLPSNMEDVKGRIAMLEEHTGLLSPEDNIEQDFTDKDDSADDIETVRASTIVQGSTKELTRELQEE